MILKSDQERVTRDSRFIINLIEKSKDEAKKEAANCACYVILTEEKYQDYKAEIVEFVKKIWEKSHLKIRSADSAEKKDDPSGVNKTPLYILNVLKKSLGIDPSWKKIQKNAIRIWGDP